MKEKEEVGWDGWDIQRRTMSEGRRDNANDKDNEGGGVGWSDDNSNCALQQVGITKKHRQRQGWARARSRR